ncbi:MAG TPA: hypothetical protein VLT89_11385 [Usitatibacter sp.]|nr:hypothetical protein [Usitatibacter sp.]
MARADFAAQIAFLSDARNHPFHPSAVTVVETHLSWVFLTDQHAYKMKKPVRLDGHDLTRIEEREAQCRNEVTLNRRLTEGVYLGVVPLTVDPAGALQLDLGGRPVDWLVWMRRLPRERMLDRMIARRDVDMAALRACVAMVSRFYVNAPAVDLAHGDFRARMAQRVAENAAVLRLPEGGLAADEVERVVRGQHGFLAAQAQLFDRRASASRIVEGHGDLRPEHLCLEAPPQVIDCLEFSRELRIVDPAEELGFLALECERLGAPELDAVIFATYRAISGDDPGQPLVHFYKSVHACVRAKLAIWHLAEPGARGTEEWTRRAAHYLRLAAQHLVAATASTGSSEPARGPRRE